MQSMDWMTMVIALGFLYLVTASPTTLGDIPLPDDNISVGSYVREVRAAPPENYHKSYENDGDGEIGYSRKKAGGGKKGYQHFDSYHKKAGDDYEFEKQDAYGLDDEGQNAAHSHEREDKAARYQEPVEENERRGPVATPDASRHDHEEIKEGDGDGNGGVEAFGHDVSDYVLPEKYTYGSGEEYNF